MRTEVISANTIEGAAEQILAELKKSVTSRDNVLYFNGWDGLGASAVLRAVAQHFTTTTSPAGLEFEKVIHIDCSKWESRRALQRAVAEQLELPAQVMKMFDTEDEEDDFRGVAQGSRAGLPVDREMYQHIQNRRFLVIFHNGSNEEIDLASLCGFPLSGYSTSKVLWTFQGRFRFKPRTKVDMAIKTAGTTDAFIFAYPHEELWPYLVLQEASEVAAAACNVVNTGSDNIIHQSEGIANCFRYMLEMGFRGRHLTDYDLDTHSANYWMCDGIIQHEQEHDEEIIGLWRAAEALHREMRLDMDHYKYVRSSQFLEGWQIQSHPYWTSPTYGFILSPTRAKIDESMFHHYADKLSVLKLSECHFDFQSPPFLCCHSIRFLWLDNCQDTRTSSDVAGKEEDICLFFQRLWALDVRNTDCDQILCEQILALMTQLRELNVMGVYGWDMGQLHGRLPNILKLRVKNSVVGCSCPENALFSEVNKIEHLEFSGNFPTGDFSPMMSSFGPGVSSNVSCPETVIVNGCRGVQQISFSGSTKLKNLHLGGRMSDLHILDISGTSVKILDLSTTYIEQLDELYLLDCKKLCAIIWPPKDQMKQELGRLCVDTTQSAYTAQSREEMATRCTSIAIIGTPVPPVAARHGSQTNNEFDWYISLRNARFVVSLEPVYSDSRKAYVEVSCPDHPSTFIGKSSSEQQVLVNQQRQHAPAIYANITVDHQHEASDTPGIMWMWPCPDVPDLGGKSCYLHIQDQMGTKLLSGGEETSTITVPKFLIDYAKILHVHDSLSMTTFPADMNKYRGSEWHEVEWCRIERCPKLDSVFSHVDDGWPDPIIYMLRTFWASHLLKARYIWKRRESSKHSRTFPYLTFLHLACCPRLIYVLPLSGETFNDPDSFSLQFGHSFSQLETIEITWCGDLRVVFPLDADAKDYVEQQSQTVTLYFPSLKNIHLHEIPRLQRICEVRMSAPNLETIKIRGCWSLTCLPDVSGTNKIVECDCEKEWWDRLEWDDGSQVEHYKPVHSQYYKKTILRTTVLR